ncbi:NUMOD1 domain protein [compost metagenome]
MSNPKDKTLIKSGVYILRNKVNGKEYVGSTNDLHRRQKEHLSDLRCNTHPNPKLQSSYNKYGVESFEFKVLHETSEKESRKIEQEYINDKNPEFNIAQEVGLPNYPKGTRVLQYDLEGKFVKEYPSMREAAEEFGISSKAISSVCRGKSLTACKFMWRYFSENYALQIEPLSIKNSSIANEDGRLWKQFWNSEYTIKKWAQSGKLIDTYDSLKTASEKNQIDEKTLSGHIRKSSHFPKSLNGFVFTVNDDEPIFQKGIAARNKQVIQFTKQGKVVAIYKNAKAVSESLNIDSKYVYQACNLKHGHNEYKGYFWAFDLGDPLKPISKNG